MKSAFSIRLWILIASILVVAGAVICGLLLAWHRIEQVEAKLTASQIERFQFASGLYRELQNLNTSLLNYALLRDPQQWVRFQEASKSLDRWIDEHDPVLNPRSPLTTEQERAIIGELNRAYDDYLSSAQAVYTNGLPAMVSSTQLVELNAFDTEAKRMRDLIRRLSEAHRTAQAAFLANSTASLASLRGILVGGVVLLMGLVAAMGLAIYRDTIAPLRKKLVLSQTLVQKQEKLATLGTLAAGIAHEIRNPLTSLKARLYTLEKHLQPDPATRQDIDIISGEIGRLERIVNDVLRFARPSDPEFEVIEARRVVEELRGLMTPEFENRGVHLEVESDANLEIRADINHLKQAIINLLRNGAEAIEGPGTVTLRTKAAQVPIRGELADAVVFEVADSGKGIRPEVENRLFDPFFTTKETGTGLGLAIASRIVEKHGGVLQYQTQPGHGTTFGVVLPRKIAEVGGRANRGEDFAH